MSFIAVYKWVSPLLKSDLSQALKQICSNTLNSCSLCTDVADTLTLQEL